MKYRFRNLEPTQEGLPLVLERKGRIGGWSVIPPAEWTDELPVRSGLNLLDQWQKEGLARIDDTGAMVFHDALADASPAAEGALKLPPPVLYMLDITCRNAIYQADFGITTSWIWPSGTEVYGEVTGAVLVDGFNTYRIPRPLYDLLQAIAAFRSADTSEEAIRFRHWQNIQNRLEKLTGQPQRVEGYLKSLRLLSADAFTLDVDMQGDAPVFRPSLLMRKSSCLEEAGEEEPNFIDLLEPKQNARFQQGYSGYEDVRDRYLLENNAYLLLSDNLRQSLRVVREKQTANPAERRSFLRNPCHYFAAALTDDDPHALVSQLFIETSSYSDRIRELGIWLPPVLPWIKNQPNTWLPEEFGIRIGDKFFRIDPNQIDALRNEVTKAIEDGLDRISIDGAEIPAIEETLAVLDSLIGEVCPVPMPESPKPALHEAPKPPKPMLLLVDNIYNSAYCASCVPRTPAIGIEPPSEALTVDLLSHQVESFRNIIDVWQRGRPGLLLADDMGLGKTLQALSFLVWLKHNAREEGQTARPVLVVAPTALLANWEQEHERHIAQEYRLGHLLRVHGRDLQALKRTEGRIDRRALSQAGWVLTTYETLRDYHVDFASVHFAAAVFDEIQKIKDPRTRLSHTSKTINADFVIGMTGTPVENRIEDIWSIYDRVHPGFLDDLRQFSKLYGNEDDERLSELHGQLTAPPPAMIRRMKDTVHLQARLPEKTSKTIRIPMPPEQMAAYDAVIQQGLRATDQGAMLRTLHGLRGRSLYPIRRDTIPAQEPIEETINRSARFKAAFEILDKIAAQQDKALVYIEDLDLQILVKEIIESRYAPSLPPQVINGGVSGPVRQARVNEFQKASGFAVMILSPRAGGVGFNITAANHVLHLSRWWNPAVEDQCNDRAYRIGQTKPVTIYHFLARHPEYGDASFDEILHNLLERKRQLSARVLIPGSGRQDVSELFKMSIPGTASKPALAQSVDSLDPLGFERWVQQQLHVAGLIVNTTPRTGDAGADAVCSHPETGHSAILQCKHTSTPSRHLDHRAVRDLMRARNRYGAVPSVLAAITNAACFGDDAQRLARKEGILLFGRDALSCFAEEIAVKLTQSP